MTSRLPPESLESRLFRTFWDDGLLDIMFGVGAIGVGVCWAAGLVPLGAIVPALLAVAWNPLRRGIIEPRAGWVEFSRARTETNRRRLIGALWLGVAGLVLALALIVGTRSGGEVFPNSLAAAIPGVLIGVMAVLVAAGLRTVRFLAYALLFVVFGLATALLEGEPEAAMLAGGGAVVLSGAWLLARFFRATVPIDQR
jgi:hypothetical protein